jgi:hypothetical protein
MHQLLQQYSIYPDHYRSPKVPIEYPNHSRMTYNEVAL